MPTAITHDPTFNTPGSSTNTAVVKWSGTSGLTIVDSGVLIDGSNNITGIAGLTATQVDITGQGDLRLQDTTGGQYVALQAAGTTTTHTLTLPANNGAADTFLQNNGSGTLSWAAATTAFVGAKAVATSNQTITEGGNRTISYHSAATGNTTGFSLDSGYTGFDNGASSNATKLWRDEAGGGDPGYRARIYIPVTGYYALHGSCGGSNNGGGYFRIQFYNEAGQSIAQRRFEAFGDADNVIQASAYAYLTGSLNGSNYVYMTLYQNSGGNMTIQPYATTSGTSFSVVKLG